MIKMLFASRPSDVAYDELEVVEFRHFPFKGFRAMQWCGKIVHRVGSSVVGEATLRHERIHVMQALHCDDSWIKYYLKYLLEWLRRGFLAPMTANYYCSKYESEAYANDGKLGYCEGYDGSNLAKYKIKNAKKLYKQLGGTPAAWKEYVKSL